MSRDESNAFVSPFLNFDPSLLVSDSNEQFIFPDGEKHRGRLERSFAEIGAMVMGGAVFGGSRGLYAGLRDEEIRKLTSSGLRRTQMLNHITKSGATWSQTAGAIGLVYALCDFAIYKLRGGADDEITTVAAATTTGCLYGSPGLFRPGGWKRCVGGGVAGLSIGALAVVFTSWSHIKQMIGG